eukprot:jgi/Orpsp1_1/1188751/evm.model.d7180000066961.1
MVSPWDFDYTYYDSPRRYWAGAFCESSYVESKGDRSNPWFILLAKEEWFHELASKKWESVSAAVRNQIPEEKNYLSDKWDDLLQFNTNTVTKVNKIHNWLTKRLDWMDEAFVSGKSVTIIPDENETVINEPTKVVTDVSKTETNLAEIETDTAEELEILDEEIEVTATFDDNEQDSS